MKKDLPWEQEQKDKLRFILTLKFEPFHKGSVYSVNGSMVEIPNHFMFYSVYQVPSVKAISSFNRIISPDFVEVDWNSPDGQAIAKSFVFTENEKKFVLMRESVASLHNPDHVVGLLRVVFLGSCTTMMYYVREFMFENFGTSLSTYLRLNPRSNMVFKSMARGSLYVFIVGVAAMLYCGFTDKYYNHLQIKADQTVAAMGLSYASGGLDYYRRLQSRNLACRNILGEEDGRNVYSENGNVKPYFFREIISLPRVINMMAQSVIQHKEQSVDKIRDTV